MPTLKIGSRDSVLALWQTQWVIDELKRYHPDLRCEVFATKTTGDKIQDVALAKIGDKGLFTKELEVSLLEKQVDVVVHSLKDLPTELPEGCALGVICSRAEPGDVLISHKGLSLKELPLGARVGTSSLRRKAQILNYRPDLQIEDLRGNVPTRLKKMELQGLDGIILAAAGIERLGLRERITEYIPYAVCLPAVGQGAIALEIRNNDKVTEKLIEPLHDVSSAAAVSAERALLRRLGGGCQIPIAALGRLQEGELVLEARVASIDGRQMVSGIRSIPCTACSAINSNDSISWPHQLSTEQLGRELAEDLLEQGARAILEGLCLK